MPIDNKILERVRNNDPRLRDLDLSGSSVTDKDLAILAEAMQQNTNLTKLVLRNHKDGSNNSLNFFIYDTSVGISNAGHARETHVGNYNNITDVGVKHLCGCKNIQYLDLSNNAIGDEGFVLLTSLPNLKELWVINCNVGQRGANHLEKFKKLTKLEFHPNPFFNDPKYLFKWMDRYAAHVKSNRRRNVFTEEKPNREELELVIMDAMKEEDLDTLGSLIQQLPEGANAMLDYGTTPLLYACENKLDTVRKFLLSHGSNTERHEREYTPLMRATSAGDVQACEDLLRHNANITGEFYFNDETPFSKSAYSYNAALSSLINNFIPEQNHTLHLGVKKNDITQRSILQTITLLKLTTYYFGKISVREICGAIKQINDFYFYKRTRPRGEDPEGKHPLTPLELLKTVLRYFLNNKSPADYLYEKKSPETDQEVMREQMLFHLSWPDYETSADNLCSCIENLNLLYEEKIDCMAVLDLLAENVDDIVTYRKLSAASDKPFKPTEIHFGQAKLVDLTDCQPPPWHIFGTQFKELTIDLTQRMFVLADELNSLINIERYAEHFNSMAKYRKIWQGFKKRWDVCMERVDLNELNDPGLYDTDDEASEDSSEDDIMICDTKLDRTRRISSILNKEIIEASHNIPQSVLDELNREIQQKGEASIDWSKYPKLFIAEYRGIHFYRNIFTREQRSFFKNTIHLNRDGASSAVYELAGTENFVREPLTRETRKKDGISKIRSAVANLTAEDRAKVAQRYSNTMSGFMSDLGKHDGNKVNQAFGKLKITKVPYYSESDYPKHALRYAYGQKPTKDLKKWRLRPRYEKTGKAKFPYPGMVFIHLFTPAQWLEHEAIHVLELQQNGSANINPRIIHERETSFPGGVEQGCCVYEQVVKIPSFVKYREDYLQKYGLNEKDFDKYQKNIMESEQGSQPRKNIKNSIIKKQIDLQIKYLLEEAHRAAKDRGGFLVYKTGDGLYSTELPSMQKIKDKRKKRLREMSVNLPKTRPAKKLKSRTSASAIKNISASHIEELAKVEEFQGQEIHAALLGLEAIRRVSTIRIYKTQMTESLFIESLEQNWQELQSEGKLNIAVLQVHGNHWVNILFDNRPGQPHKILYIDPTGAVPSGNLTSAIQTWFPDINFTHSEEIFQTTHIVNEGEYIEGDVKNCGVWVVKLTELYIQLVRLAKTQDLAGGDSVFDIKAERQRQHPLITANMNTVLTLETALTGESAKEDGDFQLDAGGTGGTTQAQSSNSHRFFSSSAAGASSSSGPSNTNTAGEAPKLPQ